MSRWVELQYELMQTENYREFLSLIFQKDPGLSYSALALRAGFASRSYPREVVTGRRRITAKTLPQFIRGLKLTGSLKNYFSLLVIQDESDLNIDGYSRSEIHDRMVQLRSRSTKIKRMRGPENFSLSSESYLEIYSALGSKENGNTLKEISRITKLPEDICRAHLQKMCGSKLVQYKTGTGCFVPTDIHLSVEELGGSEFFKRYYCELTKKMVRQAESQFNSDKHLYFTSVFSIKAEKAAQFKIELRNLLLGFVDSAEDVEGTTLARISLGFAGS